MIRRGDRHLTSPRTTHLWGTRPYTEENSARDNGLLAFITNGEGYHNFHHKFPSDFRNGVRWYQWDPTKWLIETLRLAGLARDLKKTPSAVIEKSLLRMKLAKAEARLREVPAGVAETVRPRLEKAHRALDRAVELWHEVDAKRRDLVARGRTASFEIRRSWKETLHPSQPCSPCRRRRWTES